MNPSWTSWARNLHKLSPLAKLIAYELAILADTRGVAMVPQRHLERITARSHSAVNAALAELEKRGHLLPASPAEEYFSGRRLQLRGGIRETVSWKPLSINAPPQEAWTEDVSTDVDVRHLIGMAIAANWKGRPGVDLAATLARQGPQHFAGLIARRRFRKEASDPWDTLTAAWEVARCNGEVLTAADEPWALWVHLTGLSLQRWQAPAQVAEPETDFFGFDDFSAPILSAVEELIDAGVDEAVAWAGTARILELMGVGSSRRHWLAARDAKLHALGVPEPAARAWMTLLVGSRRGRKGALTGTDAAGLTEQAKAVAQAVGSAAA